MRRCLGYLVLFLGLPCVVGCTIMQPPRVSEGKPAVTTPPSLKAKAAAPVQPGDITVANARAKAQQLLDEMDADQAGSPQP